MVRYSYLDPIKAQNECRKVADVLMPEVLWRNLLTHVSVKSKPAYVPPYGTGTLT